MTDRKDARNVTAAEGQHYINAINTMLADPANPYGKMVAIHGDMSHNMHGMNAVGTQRFLPWHRDYLLKFEKLLQAIDPLCYIPYFNWTANRMVPTWIRNFKPTVFVPGRGTVIVKRNSSIPAVKNIAPVVANNTYTAFTNALENGPHGQVHMELGMVNGSQEAMANIDISPADPIFWLHHAMIDKIWADWQTSHAGQNPALAGNDAILDPWQPDTAAQMLSISDPALNYRYV